jgi:hypothetical protein
MVLLEPSNKADTHYFNEMLNALTALRVVNSSLHHTSNRQCSIQNTIILDIQAFQSNLIH